MTNKDLDRLLEFCIVNPFSDHEEKEFESLKAKLEGELEKAEKFDSIMDTNAVMQWSQSTTKKFKATMELNRKLEQENKQLKEENQRMNMDLLATTKELIKSKETLMERNNQLINKKQKLEKIEKFADISTGIVHLTLKEILESKE